jgi:large subunit ribosomal protein L2
MAVVYAKPLTAGSRYQGRLVRVGYKPEPERRLLSVLPKNSGRNNQGRVTTRHQGGRRKRFLRQIDWQRDLRHLPGIVVALEYDPNRTADLALIQYPNGQRRYILAPEGLNPGETITAGAEADIRPGNALPLANIPVGIPIHALEIIPGKGAQMFRSAGTSAAIQGFEKEYALVKLSSGEVRRVPKLCLATVGQVGNPDWKNVKFGKAGRKRRRGIRPTVRGTAQNPRSHPHGGGEGRSGEGMPPKTPWGKPARGKKTRSKTKYSNKYIVERRK